MFQKIIAFFKLGSICPIVAKILTGLVAAINVVKLIIDELNGSKTGDRIVPYLTALLSALTVFKDSLQGVATIICGEVAVAKIKSLTLDSSLAQLDKIATDLKNLTNNK